MASLWAVQAAYKYEPRLIHPNEEFWITQKLNGVRATMCGCKLIARSGRELTGLNHIIKAVGIFADQMDLVLDGELILDRLKHPDLSDNEAFRKATGIINSDVEEKDDIEFVIFDVVPKKDFFSNRPEMLYFDRRFLMNRLEDKLVTDCTDILPVRYHGTNRKQIDIELDKAVENGEEGIMINLNTPYRSKRNRGLLKVKRFYTMDLPIVGWEEGIGRLCHTLGALIVDYKGNDVYIGTGFSDDLRDELWEKKDSLVGKICEVKYKDISSNKETGKESLQFPVFVQIREDKNTASYW